MLAGVTVDLADRAQLVLVERDEARADPHRVASVAALEPGLDEVHRWAADEMGDEEVDGVVVDELRVVELKQPAAADDGDAAPDRHRLDLVVRDIDRRHAELGLEVRDLCPHLKAQARVEVGERLVHQERLRLTHHRAAHRHALALAAGEVAWAPVEVVFEPERAGRRAHARVALLLRHLRHP